MLSVQTPATDRALLTIAELREAVGIADSGSDGALQPIGDRVSAAIVRHCGIASDGVNPPTLLSEVLTETFRDVRHRQKVILARSPVTAVSSVSEDDTALTSDDYEINPAGILTRLRDDHPCHWHARKVVVTYTAGYATVPDDLKQAAALLVRLAWSEKTRDPLIMREEVPGVLNTYYRVGLANSEGPIPPDVEYLLAPYRNFVV